MSNFYLCDTCDNRNHPFYDSTDGHINCKVFPELVDPIAVVDCGSHYEYINHNHFKYLGSGLFMTPTNMCKFYKPKEDG